MTQFKMEKVFIIIVCLISGLAALELGDNYTLGPGIVESRSPNEPAPIEDSATAAVALYKSILTETLYVRCPAYAHLFRLMKSKGSLRPILVEALAVLAITERIEYHSIMNSAIQHEQISQQFVQTAKALEESKESRDHEVYLDLLRCMKEYMSDKLATPLVGQFLQDDKRAELIASLNSEASGSAGLDGQSAPEGFVRKLAERIDETERERPGAGDLREVEDLIKALDANQSPVEHRQAVNEATGEDRILNDTNKRPKQPETTPTPATTRATVVKQKNTGFSDTQLAILYFIEMKFRQTQKSRFDQPPRVTMQLALVFRKHWRDLLNTPSESMTPSLAEHASKFVNDPVSQSVAARVDEAIRKSSIVLNAMKVIEDCSPNMKDEINLQMNVIGRTLNEMDQMFDIDEVRQRFEYLKRKFQKFIKLNID